MPYLIDGHNLIARLPGFSLADLDDEQRLLEMLQDFCRAKRQQAEVYFDKAPVGQARKRTYGGLVHAHFVRQGTTADDAIRKRLQDLGREARNWSVVSSDRQVQAEARAAQAQLVSSDDFARLLLNAPHESRAAENSEKPEGSASEVKEWLDIFSKRKKDK